MYRVWGRAFVIAVFVLVLGRVWSWGGPPNNDVSDGLGSTAGGSGALQGNTTGSANTAFGAGALPSNTVGTHNTASGDIVLAGIPPGLIRSRPQNTGSGAGALISNLNGLLNTAFGFNALYSNTDGSANTAFGASALPSNTVGSHNTAIGESAGFNLLSGHNNIYLDSRGGTSDESNTMRLGENGIHTRTFIAGIAGTPLSGSPVVIDAAGQLGILASSARYKRDIHHMGERSRGVFQLRPVTFRYTQDPQGVWQYGLIAEEVAAVYPELVVRGADGTVEAVQYHALIPLLLNELQRRQEELVGQARQLTVQSQQLAELKAQNERLQAAVGQLQERDEEQRAQNAAVAAHVRRLEEGVTRATTQASR